MKKIGSALYKVTSRPLPDDAQCERCRYFDTNDPRVRETLRENFADFDRALYNAQCRCPDMFHAKEMKAKRMWNESNLPHRFGESKAKTLNNFKQVDGSADAYKQAMDFTLRRGKPRILTFVGTYGCGKSHLLEAIARDWLHDGFSVRYEYVPSMLNELRSTIDFTENNGSLWSKLQDRFKPKLLILDDLGQESPTEWTRKILTEIVDERIRTGGWLLCATNYTKDQLKDRVDERFVSRLFDRATISVLTCPTYGAKV